MTDKLGAERPLSPHLQIYRPMLTMMMSIAHRITGAALAVGFALLTWWLVALSMGPEAYKHVQSFFGSFIGQHLCEFCDLRIHSCDDCADDASRVAALGRAQRLLDLWHVDPILQQQ